MSSGTITENNASRGGGVYVYSGTFSKSGGIIYGDTDNTVGTNENTATSAASGAGHAVYDNAGARYRDSTLVTGDNISTSLPANWGM
jgi:hypothetical protein